MNIPNSVTSLGWAVFWGCSNLASLKVDIEDPATISMMYDIFENVPTSICVLYVPKGSKELYAAADQWNYFKNIKEFYGDMTGDGEVNVADITAMIEAILNTGDEAADVNGDGRIDVSDITDLINIILGE